MIAYALRRVCVWGGPLRRWRWRQMYWWINIVYEWWWWLSRRNINNLHIMQPSMEHLPDGLAKIDSYIITAWVSNKECENFRTIALISYTSKIFLYVINERLKRLFTMANFKRTNKIYSRERHYPLGNCYVQWEKL